MQNWDKSEGIMLEVSSFQCNVLISDSLIPQNESLFSTLKPFSMKTERTKAKVVTLAARV